MTDVAPSPRRVVIFGNSGSGKSTLARRIAADAGGAHLDLDTVAWEPEMGGDTGTPTRRAFDASAAAIRAFLDAHAHWVVEGCYADLLAVAMAQATEVVFLNPGTRTCIENARRRAWEPHKYASRAAQDANLDMLVAWIAGYASRTDDTAYDAHRRLFDGFTGRKREFTSNERDG